MAGTKKTTTKPVGKANPKTNDPALIDAVAKKITNNPKFADDANMLMSANGVIARARKEGKTPEQIAKMSAAQLKKYL